MQFLSYHEHLLKLAAVIYRSGEDNVDGLLAGFAADLIREGHRIGGVVQHNDRDHQQPKGTMSLVDLMTGRSISIRQELGGGSASCSLDAAGLADAAVTVSRAIAEGVELVIVNKFSKQEAAGAGLRAEIADGVVAGLPILTAVPDKCYDDWMAFTGGYGTTLACERRVVDDWWRETSLREGRARVLASIERVFEASPEAVYLEATGPILLPDDDIGRLDHG